MEHGQERIKLFNELNNLLHPIKIPMDNALAVFTGKWELDVFSLDRLLSKNDSDYDFENAKYKGKKISMSAYIKIKFGERAEEIINILNA